MKKRFKSSIETGELHQSLVGVLRITHKEVVFLPRNIRNIELINESYPIWYVVQAVYECTRRCIFLVPSYGTSFDFLLECYRKIILVYASVKSVRFILQLCWIRSKSFRNSPVFYRLVFEWAVLNNELFYVLMFNKPLSVVQYKERFCSDCFYQRT